MWTYCIEHLHLAQSTTCGYIQAARTARRFPAIFPMLADGRLRLCTVCELAPHLSEANAGERLAAASGRTRAQLRELIASFSRPAAQSHDAAATTCEEREHPPADVEAAGTGGFRLELTESTPAPNPVGPGESDLHLRVDREFRELLRYAQALLSHIPNHGDAALLLKRALQGLVAKEETRRFGSSCQRAKRRDGSGNPRYIPADVRRRVFIRDEGRCRYTSESGHVCGSRHQLQFEHRITVADGGESTEPNVELLCRAHNQLRAEQRFGKEHVVARREQSKRARIEARMAKEREAARQVAREQEATEDIEEPATEHPHKETVIRVLEINYRMTSKQASELSSVCDVMPKATLEECIRAALKACAPTPGVRHVPAPVPPSLRTAEWPTP